MGLQEAVEGSSVANEALWYLAFSIVSVLYSLIENSQLYKVKDRKIDLDRFGEGY